VHGGAIHAPDPTPGTPASTNFIEPSPGGGGGTAAAEQTARMPPARELAHLPKAHLHLHLEGAMRPATLHELAAAAGVPVPPIRGFRSFGAFAGMYDAACRVVTGEDQMRRLVREVVEDALQDGVTWLEPSFYPRRYAAAYGGDQAVVEVVLDELATVGDALGVGTGLIVAADRTADPGEAVEIAKVAASLADRGVVGFGLANDEVGGPADRFAEAFRVATGAGLLSVPHGGELVGPESVVNCLDDCGAHRVMHGVRAVEDPELVRRLADADVCLDVCPTSNLALAVVGSLGEHPLPALLDAGVACSVNADDPLLFGPGILEEYELCRTQLGLDDAALAEIARCSLRASAAPELEVSSGLRAIDAWMA
jgi:adenosine deaminase